jgi:hypothetical protein
MKIAPPFVPKAICVGAPGRHATLSTSLPVSFATCWCGALVLPLVSMRRARPSFEPVRTCVDNRAKQSKSNLCSVRCVRFAHVSVGVLTWYADELWYAGRNGASIEAVAYRARVAVAPRDATHGLQRSNRRSTFFIQQSTCASFSKLDRVLWYRASRPSKDFVSKKGRKKPRLETLSCFRAPQCGP